MADNSFIQPSFLGGEWSPFYQGRIDLPTYEIAMAACSNGYPLEEGVWVRRPGSQFIQTTRGGGNGRVIPFAFNGSAPFTMEFTDGHIRFRYGGQLCYGPDFQNVSNIDTSSPAILTLTSAATWASGDQVIFLPQNATAACTVPYLSYKTFSLLKTDTTHFTLIDPLTGLPINGALIGWTGGLLVTVARVLDVATPYTAGSWQLVRPVQEELQVTLLHPSYPPQVLTATPLPATNLLLNTFVPGPSNVSFAVAAAVFTDGPYFDPSLTQELSSATLSGVPTMTVSSILDLNNGLGFQASDVGRFVRMHSEPPTWVVGTTYSTGNTVTYAGVYYIALSGSTGAEPDSSPNVWSISPSSHTWTWGTIASVLSTSQISVTLMGPNLLYANQPMTYAMGLYSATTGYPANGCYHEGRLWLAGAVPNRFDGSYSNQIFNFAPTDAGGTTQLAGAVTDANAISYKLNSAEVNQIVWMVPNVQGIVMGTQSGEWLIQASAQNNVLTPTSIQGHRVTKYGCANIEPRQTGLTTVFVQRYGRRLFEYLSDIFSGRFYGPNLSEAAKHLTVAGIQEIAHVEELTPIVWARMGDGSLAGTTYRRVSLFSSEPPKFNAWHRHTLGSGRLVTSICAGPDPSALVETLTMVTLDTITGIYHVELLTNLFDEDNTLAQAWQLDDAIVPACGTTSSTGITLKGMHHLNGKTVTAFVGGLGCGTYTVSSGSIVVPFGSDPDKAFTAAYLNTISPSGTMPVNNGALTIPCVVGFQYASQGQLLRTAKQVQGSNGPLMGKTRRTHMYSALLNNCVTGSIAIGGDANHTHAMNFASPGGKAYTRAQLFNGVFWNTLEADYNFENGIFWQVTGPYPASICAMEGFYKVEDR